MTDEEMVEKYVKANVHYEIAKRENGANYAKEVSSVTIKQAYLDGLKAGRETKWHYPSKGEYPKECENVLCYCKVVDVKFCRIGHTIIGGDNKIRWWSSNRSEELEVHAWKEIVLPEELKENE